MGTPGRILIADRDPETRELVRRVLAEDGYCVDVICERAPAVELVESGVYDVVVVDVDMDLLADLELGRGDFAVVLVASSSGIDEAISAVRRGAFDYVLRPFYAEDISLTVACAAARRGGGSRLDVPLAHVRKNHELLR
jgi:DNA-binding NtrC family response regulator